MTHVCVVPCVLVFLACVSNVGSVDVAVDQLPVVEISLVPPARPFPAVAQTLSELEQSREILEAGQMESVREAFVAAMARATAQIGSVIGRAMRAFDDSQIGGVALARKSLLSKGGAGFMERAGLASVGVNVLQARLPAIGPIRAKIMQVEREHVRSELDFFEQARGFPDITSFVVNELAAQLQIEIGALLGRTAAASFTSAVEAPSGKALPVQDHVKVVKPKVPYPTVALMAQGMFTRRRISEDLAAARVLDLSVKLLKAERGMIRDALRAAVARVLAQRIPSARRASV